MKKSNPISYARRATRYATDVVSGKIIASKWIKLAAKRHLDDQARPNYRWRFDEHKANQICSFAEQMRHEKGVLQGQPFRLEPWQIFILASIFGWIDASGIRKYREAFILVPRGNGKSPLAAIIALWMAFFEGEPGAEVYCVATTLVQALEVFRPAKAMVEQVDAAFKRMGITAAAKSIFQTATRSRFQPVVGKPGDGASIFCAIMDELHEATDPDQYDVFKTGANKRKNSLILIISTAGSTTEGPCRAKQRDVEQVLEGVIENERLFGVIYMADPEVDWTSREALLMANPNLGVSNDEEALLLDQAEAVRNPAKQNIFRCKHLNQWMTAASAWMNMQAWSKCADLILTADSLKDLLCWLGSDLASKLDLSATVKLFRKDIDGRPHYYAFTRSYLPEERVNAPENQHYQRWSKQGHLTATPGSSIDYSAIEADSLSDISTYKVQELAYDARYADQYSQRVSEQSGITRVETPPSPAILSPAMKELEAAVYDGRFHHDGDPVLTWCMSNVLTRETSVGNYTMPEKERPENKIDAAVALFIAMSRARLHTPTTNDSAANYFMFA
jgi:phage terminase large subunit-like protein